MATLNVRVLQVGYRDDEDVADRIDRIAALVAAQHGADLVVLPELWAHGGFAYQHWRDRAEPLHGPTVTALRDAARRAGATVHGGSIIEIDENDRLWNSSVVVAPDGHLSATYRKIHRFGFGTGEPVLLAAGRHPVTTPIRTMYGTVVRLGLATCYDLRFPELFRALVDAEATIFVVPAAWPRARVEHWTLLGRARAVENQAFMIQCNTALAHAGVAMAGTSQVVDPTGAVLARANPDTEQVLRCTIDLDDVIRARAGFPVLRDRRLQATSPG